MTMKRILSIIAAGFVALLALSCAKEEDKVIFDTSKTTPPVLVSVTVDDNVTVQYTPAVFNMNFNEKMSTYHTLALVSVNDTPANITLTAKNDGSTLTVTGKNLTNAMKARGFKALDQVSLGIVVRASIQDPSRGITNAYVDSETPYIFPWTLPEEAETPGNPWVDFTEKSPWGMIGKIASTGNEWNADGAMWMTADGNKHVAKNVRLAPEDQFKVRKDGGWDVNFGAPGEDEPYVLTVGEAIEATSGGKNLAVRAVGNYDLLLDEEAGTLTLYDAFVTYPGFDEISNWTVIGHIDSFEMDWNKDVQMTTDGEWHVAEGVVLSTTDQFKFRMDLAWTTNIGASGDTEPFVVDLDTEYEGANGGKNLAVAADGTYDLLCNPATNAFKVVESLGGKSPLVGDEPGPGPEPEPVTGWNIIGLNGDWENDILATNDGNIWTAYITAAPAEGAETTEFKWRKDGGWEENYGGVMVALGEPFEAVAGGDNIKVAAGFYKVVLDVANLTITVSDGNVWSLIGAFNEWAGDVDMVLTDGKWVSPATKLEGEFKIRHNHDWAENVGGTFVAVGEPFAAVAGGDNINVAAGTYVVTYDPTAATITVDELGWGLVGTINGWGASPDIILKEDGLFLVAKNVALTADDEIKIRYNQDWGVNRGGATVVGVPVLAVPGGDNIKPGIAGNYDVYYRPDSEVIILNNAGEDLSYWGVVGTINGWGAPDVIMYQNADGLMESAEIEIKATDEIKIRMNEDWAENRGGTFVELGQPFAVEGNGKNIVVGRDAKIQVIYDSASETITLTGEYTGDVPAFPDDIYAIGGDTEWSANYQLHGKNGQYKGFGYLSQEFKFKPNPDNWDGNWGAGDTEGTIALGGGNIAAPATAGYYMIEVDLNEMTYKLTLITTIGIIGPAQAGGWDTDTDLTYNPETKAWEATGVVLTAGDMKFRANDAWDINWGGALHELVQGGDNIAVEAGTYDVKLFAWCDGLANAILTPSGDTPATKVLFLNEFDCKNKKIEIYNASDAEIDMTGWKLLKDEKSWVIPAAHAKVPAKGFIVYTCKSDGTTDPEFGLSGTKGFIVTLQDAEGKEIDKVDNLKETDVARVEIPDGKSWGRKTDGADEFVIFDTPSIGAPNGAVNAGIKIDGNYDDWADVPSAEASDSFKAFKVWNDADNFYFYVEADPGSRLWSGGAYLYLYFDWDNDHTTGEYSGTTGMGDNKYEAYTFMYIFENNQVGAPRSDSVAKGLKLDNLKIAGTDSTAEVLKFELSIPRADFDHQVNAGDVIGIDSYRSKDGGNVYFPGYVVK